MVGAIGFEPIFMRTMKDLPDSGGNQRTVKEPSGTITGRELDARGRERGVPRKPAKGQKLKFLPSDRGRQLWRSRPLIQGPILRGRQPLSSGGAESSRE